ncbi:MAG: hypothetical protein QW505_01155 [Thermoplasmata archaeon]
MRFRNGASNASENRNLTEMAHEPKFFFVCGRCDMLVREEDDRCQFCGAEFVPNDYEEQEQMKEEKTEEAEVVPPPPPEEEPAIPTVEPEVTFSAERSKRGETPARLAARVDVIEMLEKNNTGLEFERYSGGATQTYSYVAILLKNTEKVIQEAADFGVDTEKAKKYLIFARKAFKAGKINQAMSLAEKARSILIPNVTIIIKGQISCLREAMIEMKHRGKTLAPMIIEMKTIQKALKDSRLDKAIEQTKTLMDETRKAQMRLLAASGGQSLSIKPVDPNSCIGEGI